MKRDSFIIYRSFYAPVKGLSNEDKGVLFDAICNYALDEIKPENLSPINQMAFGFIGSTLDRDSEKYQNIVVRNRENIGKRWKKNNTKNTTGTNGKISNSDNGNDNDNVNDNVKGIKKATTKFIKPSAEEIKAYCSEKKINIDENNFLDHYESNGWMVGKVKMKDWKATARKWGRSAPDNLQPQKSQSQKTPEEWLS